jgi:hypothetical protein
MADPVQVPTNGFGVPPAPPGATTNEGRPPASSMTPGFVVPAAPAAAPVAAPTAGTYTKADLDAAVAAALAGKAAPAAAAPTGAPVLTPGAAVNVGELNVASDPVLKGMTDMFAASGTGIDLDRAIGKALVYGDAALIDTAYLTEKGGAQAANLALMAKAIVGRVVDQAAAGEQAAFAAAGGKAQWQAAAGVFDQKAPAHTKLVVKSMLDSGNPELIAAASKTIVEFASGSGFVPVAPHLQAPTSGGGGVQALDKNGFQAELRKLNPNSPSFTQDRETLFVRRHMGKKLGV